MDWISVEIALPISTFINVLATDGEFIAIAYYVNDPKTYGCLDAMEEEDKSKYRDCLDPEPHWHFPFGHRFSDDGKELLMLSDLKKVTHWVKFPRIPRE